MNLSHYLWENEYISAFSPTAVEFSSLVSDTRKMTASSLFVALPGRKNDPLSLLCELPLRPKGILLKSGLSLPSSLQEIPHFFVPDPYRTLALLHSRIAGSPERKMKIIGITGTAGKSSTAELLYRILRASGCSAGLIGTIHCLKNDIPCDPPSHLTLTTPEPDTLYPLLREMQGSGIEYVVLEVSSQALSQERVAPIDFHAAVFTNLSPEHLDYHGTMEGYFLAKSHLFRKAALSVLNADDPSARRMATFSHGKTVTAGILQSADYSISDLSWEKEIRYSLKTPTASISVDLPLFGVFNVYNSLLAAVTALEIGIPPETVSLALSSVGMIRGRLEKINTCFPSLPYDVFIDYAHTDLALKSLLLSIRPRVKGRLLLLFGCGGDRDRTKRHRMGRVAAQYADILIVTSDNSRGEDPRQIFSDILEGIPEGTTFSVIPDRAEAIRHTLSIAKDGDTVLLVGKGHETYEISADGTLPFDERALVQKFLTEGAPNADSSF